MTDKGLAPSSSLSGSKALQDVAAERRRQTERKGWSTKHDDRHDSGQLAAAAAAYAEDAAHQLHEARYGKAPHWVDGVRDFGQHPPVMWPWEDNWKPDEPRRELVKAAALIVAEIERIDRAAPTPATTGDGQ